MPRTPDEVAVALRAQADEVDLLDGTLSTAPAGPDPTPEAPPARPLGLAAALDATSTVLTWRDGGDATAWEVLDERDPDPATRVKDVVDVPRSLRSAMRPTSRPRRYVVVAIGPTGLRSDPSDPIDLPPTGEQPHEQPDEPEPQPGGQAKLPTDVLPTLKTWTITTTTGTPGSPTNKYPHGFTNPDGYIPGVFEVTDDDGVLFHATVDGVTTPNSKRCRVEGRQMADAAWTKAAWNGADPHTLDADLWISTAGLTKRKRVSGLQIHDGGDDVLQVLADAEHGLIVLSDDGKTMHVLDPDYRDEQRFTCRIQTGVNPRKDDRGKTLADIVVTYRSGDRSKTVTITKVGSSWYFKAGAYLQASMTEHGEPATAYGEVVIFKLAATGKLIS